MEKYIIILMSFLAFSCTSNDEPETSDVNFSVISNGKLGGAGQEGIPQQNLVITDSETWISLMNKMDTVNDTSSHFSETDIDFSEFTVIAVFSSVKSNGGFGLDVEITADDTSIFVAITETVPGVADNVTTVITQPYYIVKIEKSDLPIVFDVNTIALP